MAFTIPWQILAMGLSGDIGGYTIYTDRFGRKVIYPKSPPEKPPTQRQLTAQQRFRSAQKAWSDLTTEKKENLEEVCKKANASMTGQNLYIHTAMTNDQTAIATLEKQTGITLFAIPYIP